MEIKHAITLDTQGLKASAKEATDILHGIGKSAEQEGDRMDAAFKKVGAAVAGFFTVQQATNFVKSMVSVRGEIESLEISFRTLVGSKDKADALFASIREFAVTTPMQLGDLAKSAQTLLGYNIEAEKIMPTLKMIGDISMGDAGKMQALTNAFAQMSSTGKLVGQDLMQMINAGFNPLAEISQKTGKSISELKDEMSKGRISVEMVEDAFKSATSEGGKFYNMLEQQSHGINGAISNLKGAWDDMLNTIGEKMQGTILSTVDAVTSLVQNFEKVGKVIADIAVTFGVYKAAIIAANIAKTIAIEKAKGYTVAQMAEYRATILLEKAQKVLNKTMLSNPFVLAATALAGLIVVTTRAVKAHKEANKELSAYQQTMQRVEDEYDAEAAKIDMLNAKIHDETSSMNDRKQAISDLQEIVPAYHASLTDEGKLINDNADAIDEYCRQLERQIRLKAVQDDLEDAYKKRRNLQKQEKKDQAAFDEANDYYKTADWISNSNASSVGYNSPVQRALYTGTDPSLSQAKTAMLKAQSELKKTQDAIADVEAVIAEYEEEIRSYEPITPTNNSNGGNGGNGGGGKKSTKDAEAAMAKAKREREEQIAQYGKDVANAMKDAEFEIRQADINAMQEGNDKTLAQIQLNYDKAIEANMRRRDEWIEAMRDEKEVEWEDANVGHAKDVFFDRTSVGESDLSKEQLDTLNEYARIATEARQNAERAMYDALLRQYETYEQQRLRLTQEMAKKERMMFDDEGNLREGFSTENWLKVVDDYSKKNEEISLAISDDAQNNSEVIKSIYTNAANQTADELQANIELAEQLLAILNGADNTLMGSDGNLMFTTEQVNAMRQDGEFIKKMLQSIIDKKDELRGRKGAMGQFVDSIKELMDAFGKSGSAKMEGISKAMQKMLSSAGALNSVVGDIAGKWREIGELTKNDTLKGVAGTVEGISGTLSDTMSSISAGLAIGGPVGGAIMGAISLVTSLFKTASEHQDELEAKEKELSDEREEAQAAYNLLLIEQNELLKEATNIFKEDALKAAMGYAQQLAAATDLYNSSLSALYGANVRSGSHQEGWWIFGSQVDDYSSILSMYPQLIDESGRLNNELLQRLLDTLAFEDEATRAALERLLQYNDAVEEARDNLRSYLSDTFGSLADGLMDAITKALDDGSDALKSFSDSVSAVLRDMGEQLAYSLYFAKFFNNLQEQLEEIFEDTSLSPEEIMNQSAELLMGFFDNIGDQIDGAEGFLQQWQDMMEERGFNMFDRQMEQSTGIAASQESVDKLDGRMTVVQGHTYMMNENLKIVTNNVGVILSSVRVIEANTSHISDTLDEVRETVSRNGAMIDNIDTRGVKIRN